MRAPAASPRNARRAPARPRGLHGLRQRRIQELEVKREGELFGEPPLRDVTGVTELVGPRGGVMYVLSLSCEHWRTCRKLPSKTEVPCIGCLVEAALRAKRSGRSSGVVK